MNTDKYNYIDQTILLEHYEYGKIFSVNVDKGYGFIKVKDWAHNLFFHQSNFIGLFDNSIISKNVRFNPILTEGKRSAVNVEIVSNMFSSIELL